ncbi:MAG: ATP-grasp domain-containing protein [Pseudomonadota bacterium]
MKVLLTLGRLPKALDIARALAAVGCEVIVAEPFAWHLTRLSRSVERCVRVPAPNDDEQAYHQALISLIEREGVDLVVPVSDETMHVGGLHARLPASTRLFCPPQPTLLSLHDKLEFIRVAQAAGLPVPRTCDASDHAGAEALLAATRCISKPRYSSAGKGLVDHPQGTEPPVHGPDSVPRIFQEYLPGEELSTFGVVRNGELVANVVYRGLIMSGTVAVSFERLVESPPGLEDWVRTFAKAAGHEGFLSFDFRLDEAGRPLPMECNPRATSGIHFLDPLGLADVMLGDAAAGSGRLRPETRLQQFYPALTEVQSSFLRGERSPGRLKLLFGLRDVTWQANDPLPLLLQPFASVDILWRTILKGWTFGEAATFDIAWGE